MKDGWDNGAHVEKITLRISDEKSKEFNVLLHNRKCFSVTLDNMVVEQIDIRGHSSFAPLSSNLVTLRRDEVVGKKEYITVQETETSINDLAKKAYRRILNEGSSNVFVIREAHEALMKIEKAETEEKKKTSPPCCTAGCQCLSIYIAKALL